MATITKHLEGTVSPWSFLQLYYLKPSVQFSHSVLFNSATPWTAASQASLSITNYWSLFKLMPIESVMPPNHFILYHPLLLPPSIFPSIRVFSTESVLCIRGPKYWGFNEYSGLIFFRIDQFDFAVQGTLKNLLQHHSSSINSSALSFLYSPTLISIYDYWKNHSFDYTDLCVMSLLFIMLSRLVIAFLPRSKQLLISWLQFTVGAQENKICHCFNFSPFYLP